MSSLQISCPHCEGALVLEKPQPGAQMTCPHCTKVFAIGAEKGIAGRRVGNYEIIERVGIGRMGAVFRARRLPDQHVVAIKLLKTALAQSPTFVQRFQREVQAAQTLDHPNLVKAYDFGIADGYYYYAMEFIEGETLAAMLARGQKFNEDQALIVAQAVAEALRCAWDRKIVHRDIKPENIMAQPDGRIRLMDMGLAKEVDEPGATVTQAGGVLGSPAYAAPEQLRGQAEIDVRADLYALGTTLFHLVCGQQPFTGPTSGVVAARQLSEPLPDPRTLNQDLSLPFCKFLARLAEKNPKDRYQTPEQVLQAIGEMKSTDNGAGEGTKPRQKIKPLVQERDYLKVSRLLIPIATAGALLLGVLMVYFLTGERSSQSGPSKPEPPASAATSSVEAVSKDLPKPPKAEKPPDWKKPTVAGVRKVVKKNRTPESLARLEQFPTLKDLWLDDLFHSKLEFPSDGMISLGYLFSDAKEFYDWGNRGQAAGKMVVHGGGTMLNARFLESDFHLECDGSLQKGSEFGVTLYNPASPSGFSATLFAASASGAFLRVRAAGSAEVRESDKQKGGVISEKLRLTLETTKEKISGSCGPNHFEIPIPPSGPIAVKLHAGPESVAIFESLRVQGRPDPAWAGAALARVEERQWIANSLDMERSGENFALTLGPGTLVELPKGFPELTEWAIEMFVQVKRAGDGAQPLPPLFVCGNPAGAADVIEIDPQSLRVRFHPGRTSPASPDLYGLWPFNQGEWHHLAVTSDGSTMQLFVNGVLDCELALPTFHSASAAAEFTGIGSAQATDPACELLIDDVRISKKALYRKVPFKPRAQSLRADKVTWLLLRCDENGGSVLKDSESQLKGECKATNPQWVSVEKTMSRNP